MTREQDADARPERVRRLVDVCYRTAHEAVITLTIFESKNTLAPHLAKTGLSRMLRIACRARCWSVSSWLSCDCMIDRAPIERRCLERFSSCKIQSSQTSSGDAGRPQSAVDRWLKLAHDQKIHRLRGVRTDVAHLIQ